MKATVTAHAWILVIVALFLAKNGEAFQIKTNCGCRSRMPRCTSLGVAEKKPRWTELPRVREPRRELSGFEINTGRVAMVGFCGLLAREIMSGESFGQQLVHAVSVAAGLDLPI